MRKSFMRKCAAMLSVSMLFCSGTAGAARAETQHDEVVEQTAPEVEEINGDAVHIAYSYDAETEKATVGTTEGAYIIEEIDSEHGKSIRISSAGGGKRLNFMGEDLKENPLMELLSFEVYCEETNLRSYSEFIDSTDTARSYFERYKRMFFLNENGKTTYFQDLKSSGYRMSWDRNQKQWYKLDVCADYINREFIFYIDGEQCGKVGMTDDMDGFLGMSYVLENVNEGTEYLDNIKYVQVLKRGEKLGLDGMVYPEYIERGISAEINTNRLGSILFDKNAEIDIELENVLESKRNVELEAIVKAQSGIVGAAKKYTVSIDGGEKKTVKINPIIDKYGFNTLILKVTDKESNESYTITKDFSVAHGPDNGEMNSKIAVCDHTASHAVEGQNGGGYEYEKFELMKNAGVSSVRFELNWNYYEKQGTFTLPGNFRKVYDSIGENGMDYFCLLLGGNQSIGVQGPPRTAFEMQRFADYGTNIAKEVKDISHRYEIWNEYNHIPFNASGGTVDDYIEMLKTTGAAIKKVDPDAKIYGLGGVTVIANVYDWVEEFLQKGGQNYCDGFSFHPYTPGSPAASAVGVFNKFMALFEKYGVTDKDLILSEIGWTTNGVSEMNQASYEVEFAASVYDKIETIYWYVDQEKQINNPSEDKFGMIHSWDAAYCAPYEPFSAKPAFLAMAYFNRVMNGAKGTQNKIMDDTIELKGFKDRNGKSVTLLWNTAEKYKNMALKLDADRVTVSDIYGNENEMALTDGVINVTVGGAPIYIIGDYTDIEQAEPTCELSENTIQVTTEDVTSLYIKKNFNEEAVIEVKTPQNVSVLQNDGFDENNHAELKLKTGSQRNDNEEIEVIIKAKNGNAVYSRNAVSLNYADTISGSALAKYFRSRRWQGSIKIKSNKHTEKTSGTIKITKPDYLASILGEFRFDDIGPLQTKEFVFNIPDTIADVKTVVEAEVTLDNGETFKIADDVYFTGFARSKTPPIIDGDIGDDEWDKNIAFRLQYLSQVYNIPDWGGPLDVGGRVYGQWDNDNLYIAAVIDDDVHYTTDESKRIWYVDSIQIAVSEKKDKNAIRTEFGFGELNGELAMERYSFMGVDTAITGWTDKQDFKEEVKLAVKRDEEKKKTYYEIAIPWKHLYGEQIKPASRDCLYFSMLVNDNDGNSRGWIEFCPGIGATKDASKFINVPIIKNR